MYAGNTQNPNMCDSTAELDVLLFYGEIPVSELHLIFLKIEQFILNK